MSTVAGQPTCGANSIASAIRSHPRGLPVIISLKVWELFSYQGMRAYLVLYLIDTFALSEARATLIIGSYAALVLSTSVLGGYCADRWMGPREGMLTGATMIMCGHLTLALDNLCTALGFHIETFQLLCLGLALIAVGTGLLKPNVLTMIGRLYRVDDPKRETGYYIYYIGVNIGSFIAPIVCGGLASRYGWTWGFAAAAIGMACGLIIFLVGRRYVRALGEEPEMLSSSVPRKRLYAALAAAVAAAMYLVQHGFALGLLLALSMAIALFLLFRRARHDPEPREVARAVLFLALVPVPIFFELLFEQIATSVTLFSDRAVDRQIGGVAMSAPQLLSLNSLFVLCLLPIVATLWARLERRGEMPAPFVKFTIGFALIAVSFLTLAAGAFVSGAGGRVNLGWVIAAYLFLTLGELCIAPLAFSLVGRMVSASYSGLAMGIVLLSFAIGNFLSSLLAGAISLPADLPLEAMKVSYGYFFLSSAVIAAATASLAFCGRRIGARGD